ncbi:NPCBM/NEW2 domain-containing protein [Streptomyces sp. NBC_01190]|uniref:NPCBM/NEW2 domain-containing protein n=1 Tax=Streptomyces sp. NBC_01190 TaxID=2903767 RepID=UPI0038707CF4|nr:NPCBM/NEW2 domain-containing protein [Streptomyces sp. NBC_01190]
MTIEPGSGETPPSRETPPPRPSAPPPASPATPPAAQPAAPPHTPQQFPGPSPRSKRDLSGIANLVNAGIGVAALVLGFFGGAGVQATAGGPFSGPTTTVTVTPTGTPVPITPATTPPAPNTTPGSPNTTSTVALSTLTPLSGPFQSANTTPSLDGRPQPQAIIQDLGCAASGDAQYNLSRGYTRLTAQVGLDDNSPDSKVTPTLTIVGDGRQLTSALPKFGTPSTLDVDVTGVIRLEIKWSYQRPPQTPIPIVCTPNAQLVVADGQLTQTSA